MVHYIYYLCIVFTLYKYRYTCIHEISLLSTNSKSQQSPINNNTCFVSRHEHCMSVIRQRFIPTHAGMKSIPILTQLSKCWDFLWDIRFNDVIPRTGDLIFFQSDILCQTCPIPQQIYIYVLIIYTKDKSFLDYAR